MKFLTKFFLLSLVLFLSIGFVSASDVDDTQSDVIVDTAPVETTQSMIEDYEATDNTLEELEENEEPQQCSGRTYENPISITPSNYADQIGNIYNYDAVEFSGTFTSSMTGGSISITNPIVFTTTSSATFEDTQFIINSNDVTIKGLTIVNDDETDGAAITAIGHDNIEVIGNYISVTKTTYGETVGIKFNSTNNQTICGNTIVMSVFPQYRWEEIESTPYNIWVFHLNNSAIVVDNSNDVRIKNNNIQSSNSTITEVNGTNEGMNIRNSNYVNVTYNDVTINNGDFAYGITFENVLNSNMTYNEVEVTAHNYACGAQLIESKNNIVSYNNFTATSRNDTTPHNYETVAYGIYMSTNWGAYNNYNNLISNNKIIVDASVVYGIEGYIVTNITITGNTIIATGNCSMGVGLYNSSDIDITNNIITVTGATRTLNSNFYEMITPETTGIKTMAKEDTQANYIENNSIFVSDSNVPSDELYAVSLYDDNNYVRHNTLTAGSNTEDGAVYDDLGSVGSNSISDNH